MLRHPLTTSARQPPPLSAWLLAVHGPTCCLLGLVPLLRTRSSPRAAPKLRPLLFWTTRYVLEQTTLGLLKFDVNSTNFVSSILSDLPDVPEKILLVNEC